MTEPASPSAVRGEDDDLAPRRLVVDRRHQIGPALVLVCGAGAVLFEMATAPLVLRGLAALIVLALLILGVAAVVRPPAIELDQRGLTIRRAFGGGFEPWSTCSAFTRSGAGRRELVSFTPGPLLRTRRCLLTHRRPVGGGALTVPADLDRLPPEELVALLNHYRDAGRARTPDR